MSWTDPPTFVSGDPLAADDLNTLGADLTYLKAIADGVGFLGVDLTRVASTSIADSTATDVTWTAENFDYGSWWSSGTDIVVPSVAVPSGYTTIALLYHFRCLWDANTNGVRFANILLNGSAVGVPGVPGSSPDQLPIDNMGFIAPVSAADVIKIQLEQTSGGALDASQIHLTIVRYAPIA